MFIENLEPRIALSVSASHGGFVGGEIARGVQRAAISTPVPAKRTDLVTTGRNRFFILEAGFTTIYVGNEDGQHKRLTVTVLAKTRIIDGIRTRIVLERQTANGHIEEISQNYFAIDKRTLNFYYFGEDVNSYNHGVVANHDGAWRSGVNGAKFGLNMPANPVVGMQYEQERAPGVAQDQAEIFQMGLRAHVPAGIFHGSMKTAESSPLEPGVVEYKLYAPGIGLVQDDTLELVSHSRIAD